MDAEWACVETRVELLNCVMVESEWFAQLRREAREGWWVRHIRLMILTCWPEPWGLQTYKMWMNLMGSGTANTPQTAPSWAAAHSAVSWMPCWWQHCPVCDSWRVRGTWSGQYYLLPPIFLLFGVILWLIAWLYFIGPSRMKIIQTAFCPYYLLFSCNLNMLKKKPK